MGGAETDLPRCGVDNLNSHGSRDNLLDNDTIKDLRLWQRKDIQRLGNNKLNIGTSRNSGALILGKVLTLRHED